MSLFKITREDEILFWEWDDPSSRLNLISEEALSETEALLSRLENMTGADPQRAATLRARTRRGQAQNRAGPDPLPARRSQNTAGARPVATGSAAANNNSKPEAVFEGIKALILISGKPDSFIAGADLKELSALHTEEEILSLLEKAHSLLARLSALPLLKIAAIHGPCLGAGLELTLAFDIRLSSDSRKTRLGLPETRFGLIPGWGGGVRLPRLIGQTAALKMILGGRTVSSLEAQALGLVNERAPPGLLRKAASRCAKNILAKGKDGQKPAATKGKNGGSAVRGFLLDSAFRRKSGRTVFTEQARRLQSLKAGLIKSLLDSWIFYAARRRLLKKAPPLTAPFAALEAVKKAWRLTKRGREEQAFKEESRIFAKQALQPESRRLRRLFFLTNQKKRAGRGIDTGTNQALLSLKNLGLIGAGTMGSAIARAAAARNISVRLRDKSEQALSRAMIQSDRFFKTERRLAPRLFARAEEEPRLSSSRPSFACFPLIFPSLDLQGFENLDLVIEAAAEDEETKNKLFQELAARVQSKQDRLRRLKQEKARGGASARFWKESFFEGPIVASNTSSLSIQSMAANWPWPSRFLGLHFFNPADKTALVEVIKTDKLSQSVLESVLAWTRRIGKIPLIVKDSPGFLVNRITAPFLCETLWLLAEGLQPDFLDSLFERKFGMRTGPFRLMDGIGLDIVFQALNCLKKAGLPLDIPDECADLPSRLGKGRKAGRGFYLYDVFNSEQGIGFSFSAGAGRTRRGRAQNRTPFPLNPQTEELFSLSKASGAGQTDSPGAGFRRRAPLRPGNLLQQFRRSGRGLRESDPEEEILDRGIFPLVNEGFKALEEEIVPDEGDVDWALVMGAGFPPWRGGPLTYGRERGLNFIGKKMQMWRKQYGARFRLSETLKKAGADRLRVATLPANRLSASRAQKQVRAGARPVADGGDPRRGQAHK